MTSLMAASQVFFLTYGLILVFIVVLMTVRGYILVRRSRHELRPVLRPDAPGVSIIVPAYNEAVVIESTVRNLLANPLPDFEIVVADDGSTDDTAAILIKAFDLVRDNNPVPTATLIHRPVSEVWRSSTSPLLLVRKENGGTKADAANAALAYASKPVVAVTDADTVVEGDSLARLSSRFRDPELVGVGGTLRLLNGARMREGDNPVQAVPDGWLERIQVVEYLRAFAGSRLAWADWRSLLIVSGGFGLFRRESLLAIGGYEATATAEDFDVTVRLQRHIAETGRGRMDFVPQTVAWTEAPATLRGLASQRARWQRGLVETLWEYRAMTLRPKYGRPAMLALPFFWLFELAAPFVELLGLAIIMLGVVLGFVSIPAALVIAFAAWIFLLSISFANIALDQMADHRYGSWREIGKLCAAAILETLGYRQYLMLVRVKATLTIRRAHRWEPIPRSERVLAEQHA